MRTIGLLGGVSWHSTATYYDLINRGVAKRLGPFRSAELVLHSIDYGHVRAARSDGNFKRLGAHITAACRGLQRAGADGIFLCSNTIHRYAPRIESQVSIPLLHIADALADRANDQGIDTLALFGTAFTMTQPFYRDRLSARGIRVLTPNAATIAELNTVVLEELTAGVIRDPSRQRFLDAMEGLTAQGAQAMVLGCTEIGLLVRQEHVDVPVLDTTEIHASAAVDWALAEG